MGGLRVRLEEAKAERNNDKAPRFAPAGQSTQMIIGADAASDRTILDTSANLYGSYQLKRVYYSAFSPIPDASRSLPLAAPPLLREHRLYQADWLLRFYGFSVEEIAGGSGMMEEEQYVPWQIASNGYWCHPLAAYDANEIWTSDPKHTPYRDVMRNALPQSYKGTPGEAASAVRAEGVVLQMYSSVVAGDVTAEEAAAEAQRRAQRFYDRV